MASSGHSRTSPIPRTSHGYVRIVAYLLLALSVVGCDTEPRPASTGDPAPTADIGKAPRFDVDESCLDGNGQRIPICVRAISHARQQGWAWAGLDFEGPVRVLNDNGKVVIEASYTRGITGIAGVQGDLEHTARTFEWEKLHEKGPLMAPPRSRRLHFRKTDDLAAWEITIDLQEHEELRDGVTADVRLVGRPTT